MAFDYENQHFGAFPGANAEWGVVTLGVGGTVEVPTNMSVITAAIATFKGAGTGILICDLTITAGAVTLASTVAGDTVEVSYMFLGLP